MSRKTSIGVLAFQGDFAKHEAAFRRLHCEVRLIKYTSQLDEIDALVIPGGESSVINRFVVRQQMVEPLRRFAQSKPIWGTCAGMILLATKVENDTELTTLSLLNITVSRNAYGRQYESFVDYGDFSANGKPDKLEMVFIRAPKIIEVGAGVEVLGHCRGESTVVQQGRVLATAFHPELTDSTRIQEHFLSLFL